ncbi:glycosyltransferase family 4 protein [Chloroflexota bacterium]
MSKSEKILIFTSVHDAFDSRIYEYQAKTLVEAGYEIILVAIDIHTHQTPDGICIIGIPKPKWRSGRLFNWFRFVKISFAQKADIYHFHDPDLLPVGLFLKLLTQKPVIYDRHENYQEDILFKEWIPKPLRYVISILFEKLEQFIASRLSAVIVIVDEHLVYFDNAITVHNYPKLEQFLELSDVPRNSHKLIYTGGLGEDYGIQTLIRMLALLKNQPVYLELFGYYRENQAEVKAERLLCQYKLGDDKFRFRGRIPYDEVRKQLVSAMAGLIALQDIPAFYTAFPRKMFEYMACGLPIIASNLKAISRVITDANCGILVEPDNPEAFAEAVTYLIDHPQESRAMGENGRRAVMEKYNWTGEAQKLLNLYQSLLKEA